MLFIFNFVLNIELSTEMADTILAKVIPISSGIIGATGAITNSLSLSYFVGGTEKTLSSRIFIMLNVFDLLVCLFDVLSVAFYFCKGPGCGLHEFPFRLSLAVFDLSIESTAYATCLLGVTRAIAVCLPFYKINSKAIAVASAVFLGQESFRALLRFYFFYFADESKLFFYIKFDNTVMIVFLTLFVIVNSVSSIMLAWELLANMNRGHDNALNRKSMTKSNRKATVTVLIVSVFFLFFNTIFGVCLYLEIFIVSAGHEMSHVVKLLGVVTIWLAVPLSSALNPAVYFLRRKSMRQHILELPRRLLGSVTQPEAVRRRTRPSATGTEMRTVNGKQ